MSQIIFALLVLLWMSESWLICWEGVCGVLSVAPIFSGHHDLIETWLRNMLNDLHSSFFSFTFLRMVTFSILSHWILSYTVNSLLLITGQMMMIIYYQLLREDCHNTASVRCCPFSLKKSSSHLFLGLPTHLSYVSRHVWLIWTVTFFLRITRAIWKVRSLPYKWMCGVSDFYPIVAPRSPHEELWSCLLYTSRCV